MIEARELTKRYGSKTAVDALSFTVRPGIVTGFLGPNGAGKSTTFRCILGLDRPTSGSVTVEGRDYADLPAPLREVGALLEARAVHPGRTARNHLRMLATTHGIPRHRVDEVLGLVGLEEVADRRVGQFSLGMGQRLGVAVALLGDPRVLLLDEPVNGLDPEGIRWMRSLLQHLAQQGRTIFVSSHLMSEMAQVATHLIVIGRGRLIADTSVERFIANASASRVLVRTPQRDALITALRPHDAELVGSDGLLVAGMTCTEVGEVAFRNNLPLHELTQQTPTLEEAFMAQTVDAIEYHADTGTSA